MYNIYKKNEINFALIWIVAYVVLMSIADNISGILGVYKSVTTPLCIALTVLAVIFIKKHDLAEYYGLCKAKCSMKTYLFFIPLLIICSSNLWNGFAMNRSLPETILHIVSMLCVGFLEEIIFRGFLFKGMAKGNIKVAILVSSLTFGMGHIVNLLNGRDLLQTILQVMYATAIGFLFTIIFYKGKSLWPCIIAHGVINSLSIFGVKTGDMMRDQIIPAIVLIVVPVLYALWILKTSPEKE